MAWKRPLLACAVLAAMSVAHVSAAGAEEPFDYFANSWNVVGLKDYQHGARVTPRNELLLAGGAKLTLRFGRGLQPLSRKQTKTCLDGWYPIIKLTAADGKVEYEFTVWATPLPTVKDWEKAFDWPTEGENFLCWIRIAATNAGAEGAEGKVKADIAGKGRAWSQAFAWSLAPGKRAEAVLRVPFAPVAPSFAKEDADLWLGRTVGYWKGLVGDAARITVPCRKATEAMLAAHVCQLIANDHGELQGGEGFYDNFYIRDGGYQIMELEEAGLWDASAKAVACYLRRQRSDGRFETQKNQFDANGQALWVLWQYWKITADKAWLAKAYPQMAKAVAWIKQARRKAPADSPFAGVLPAAPADGEYLWDGKHHILGYDFWNLRGLLCTADAARAIGKDAEADAMLAEAKAYRAAIDAVHQRTGLAHFPPSWEKAGTHWGNTETLWPTEIFDRDDPRVAALIKHLHRGHHPLDGAARRHPSLYGLIHDDGLAAARRPRDVHRGLLLVPPPHHGDPRLPRGHLLQAAGGLEQHHPPRHRRLELRLPAPPHARPRARRHPRALARRARLVARRRSDHPRRARAHSLRHDEPDGAR